jgi:predicted helicase
VRASKIITFHSRVQLSQNFAKNEPRGIAHYLDGYDVRHVNGKQNSAARSDAISAFAAAPHGMITNARCLTEGVDIPAVDMVAFIDPRQSKVDIVQAIGRAMRKPRGATTKTVGYVLVPLFAGVDGDSLDDAIKTEKFDAIADVLNALQEHDDELVDIIRELKKCKGEDKPFKPKRPLEKIEFIGPEVGFEELVNSIAVEITDRLGVSWDEMYGRLVKYKEHKGLKTTKASARRAISSGGRRAASTRRAPPTAQNSWCCSRAALGRSRPARSFPISTSSGAGVRWTPRSAVDLFPGIGA